uniref:Cytochrome b-c1 complex subunit 7 n=1 Tax=Sus scrofa TaxID=9823 RepID=A0A4X1VRW7_PIG
MALEDTISLNDDNVREARRRLPEKLYNDRVFRIKRALVLTKRQQILPKKQWTNYEEDKSHLEPYLKGEAPPAAPATHSPWSMLR